MNTYNDLTIAHSTFNTDLIPSVLATAKADIKEELTNQKTKWLLASNIEMDEPIAIAFQNTSILKKILTHSDKIEEKVINQIIKKLEPCIHEYFYPSDLAKYLFELAFKDPDPLSQQQRTDSMGYILTSLGCQNVTIIKDLSAFYYAYSFNLYSFPAKIENSLTSITLNPTIIKDVSSQVTKWPIDPHIEILEPLVLDFSSVKTLKQALTQSNKIQEEVVCQVVEKLRPFIERPLYPSELANYLVELAFKDQKTLSAKQRTDYMGHILTSLGCQHATIIRDLSAFYYAYSFEHFNPKKI